MEAEMLTSKRPGARIACALSLVLSLMFSNEAKAGTTDDILAWRTAQSTEDLVDHLERWLDRRSDWPRRAEVPDIRWIGEARAASLSAERNAAHSGRARGFYDPDNQTIFLVRPWSARNPEDVSVLLHELAHHRQAEAGHWYCPGAQELPAYRLQEAWLADLGLKADINWIAVVLEAGCTPRDFHPD